ncbi:hypothetical protein [Phaeobacter phage MD18]|nr:hypothetical protein [Phaeobacter phage MD18]
MPTQTLNRTATVTVYVEKAGTEFECTVEAEGTLVCGGSNAYGSDEPAWAEVEGIILRNSRGDRVSQRFTDALSASDWEHIAEALEGSDGG